VGDGFVLEQGTHNELLRDENGPYSRLVAAQKLREKRKVNLTDIDSDTTGGDGEGVDKKARYKIPLWCNNSSHSLPREIIEKNTKLQSGEMHEDGHSLPYLFMRMGKLHRAGWKNYAIGVVTACSTYLLIC